jgi:quinol-cytochrome oxidoreductase complex cytochrome b subunit
VLRPNNLILHFRPRTVPRKTLKFTFTWGLGGMALVLVLLLAGTGILLKFVYQPFPAGAYASIIGLRQDVWFGQFIRNLHHWSANFLIIVVFLHMLRVFFSGAFTLPRRTNWVIGLVLFLLVLSSNFTGYLLPWDQLAYWAITISTSMLAYIPGAGEWLQQMVMGGPEIGPATMQTFFALHTAVLPLCLLIFLPYHFWRIRKAGGLVIPRHCGEDPDPSSPRVPAIPDLLLRETVAALVLIAVLMVVSLLFDAPLEAQANPGLSPNPTKAPWYFMGIQELLLHIHPLFAAFIIPITAVAALFCLPFIRCQTNTAGIWFRSSTGRRLAVISAAVGAVITPLLIVADEFFIKPSNRLAGVTPELRGGLLPTTVILAALAGYGWLLRKKLAASRQEVIQAVFVLMVVSIMILTATGIWFRGPAMALVWPWQAAGAGP